MTELLCEYTPARFGPMTVALLFILMLATPLAFIDRAFAGRLDQAGLALLPVLLLLLFAFLGAPSPLRVFDDAIEVSRPRLARLAGARTRIAMADIENVYPSFYEDAGMKFSPFASAEGTAKHAGIRIETVGGEKLVVAFTPAVLNLRRRGTPAYNDALAAMRKARTKAGLALIAKPPDYTQERIDAMLVEASRPLLAFPITVGGIFAPAFLIPVLLLAATQLMGSVPDTVALLLAAVGLAPLVAVFAFVNVRSHRRAEILHEVQKFREFQREQAAKG